MSLQHPGPQDNGAPSVGASGRPDRVTAFVQHEVRSDSVPAYEAWLERIHDASARFSGHRGGDVVRAPVDGATRYTVAVRFDTVADAERWFSSAERDKLMNEAADWMVKQGDVNMVTGIDFWFDAPRAGKSAKPWRQFLVTLAAIYPLTVLIPLILEPLLSSLPDIALLQRFIVTACVVALMTWIVMPRFTRAVSGWLYK